MLLVEGKISQQNRDYIQMGREKNGPSINNAEVSATTLLSEVSPISHYTVKNSRMDQCLRT